MTFETPTVLSELRTALRERCQLDAADPRATDAIVTDALNAAWHRLDVSNPHGWPWDIYEYDGTLAAGTDSALFLLEGADSFVSFRSVILGDPNGQWSAPLERLARHEQQSRYPSDSEVGIPQTWSVNGYGLTYAAVLKFAPVPTVNYPFTVRGSRLHSDLVLATDPGPAVLVAEPGDFRLPEYADALIEYAAYVMYRARNELADAMAARATFDDEVLRLRTNVRLTAGAGVGTYQPINPEPLP